MWHRVMVIIGALVLRSCEADKWSPQRSFINHDYTGLLLGIDQRLRGIDPLRNAISRSEVSIQTLLNRMDIMETRIQTIQSSFQHTLETVTTAVKSSEMKYELLLEQLGRKVEGGFDRLQHRVNTLQAHAEANINKLQNQMDQSFGKVEAKQVQLNDDLARLGVNLDVIRSQQIREEETQNYTVNILVTHLQGLHIEQGKKREQLKNITNQLENLHTNRTECFTQNDAPILPGESIKIIRSEVSEEMHKVGAKVNNMYNDLWRTLKDMELSIKSGFEETNATTRDLYSRLTEILFEEQKNSESFMDVVMRSVLTSVGDNLNDLQRHVDNKFKDLKNSQENQGEPCHKTNKILENQVALILTKIYDTFINRTDRFSKQVVEVAEILKAHNKQLSQSTGETSRLLITLAHESSQDHKQLDSTLADLSDSSQDLQIQNQELNDSFLKNQVMIREIKNLVISLKENHTSSKDLPRGNLQVVAANFTNGVLNIKMNSTEGAEGEKLEKLNKTIGTDELEAVMGEHRTEGKNKQEAKPDKTDDFDAEEEMVPDDDKPIDSTQLLLAYIKLLHGNLSPGEFLLEAIPGSPFQTFPAMIAHLRRVGGVPRETIGDLEQFAQEQNLKEISAHQTDTDSETWKILERLHHSKSMDLEDENYDDEE